MMMSLIDRDLRVRDVLVASRVHTVGLYTPLLQEFLELSIHLTIHLEVYDAIAWEPSLDR